jgi:hypothetical protein
MMLELWASIDFSYFLLRDYALWSCNYKLNALPIMKALYKCILGKIKKPTSNKNPDPLNYAILYLD